MSWEGPPAPYRIETARLVVRCYEPRDAALLKDAVDSSLDHLRPWMPWAEQEPQTLEEKTDLMKQFRSAFDTGENFVMGVFSADESELIGGSGLHPRNEPGGLEIGVFTGWSGIEIARGLPPGGKLLALDVEEETTAMARRYAEECGVADRIEYRVCDAKAEVTKLDGPWDLVFIDAWKPDYIEYYEQVLPKLADDGVILADNTLSESVQPFNEHVLNDERVECVLVPIRDGVTLIRKR